MVKKAEHWRIDACELWCWRRLLRALWTARRSSQSILKQIPPDCSLEGLMLKLRLQYFGHWRTVSLEKILMLGKIEDGRRRGWQRIRWLNDITDLMDMSLSKLRELVMDGDAWRAEVQWGHRDRQDCATELNWNIETNTNRPKGRNGWEYNNRGDFNTSLTSVDKSSRQKINKATEILDDVLGQLDLIDIFRTFSSVQSLRLSATLWTQHTRPPCPSPTPRVYSDSCPWSRWCHPTISSSVVPFSSHLQSFPASGSFPMSQFFTSGGQNVGVLASASVLPMSNQELFALGLTGLMSLQSKGLSRVFSNTTVFIGVTFSF